jgi:hypothetical protein
MADNVVTTLAPPPILLTDISMPPGDGFQFAFTNTPGANFVALASSNPAVPLTNWTSLGTVPEISAGKFQFTDLQTQGERRFYSVRSQ